MFLRHRNVVMFGLVLLTTSALRAQSVFLDAPPLPALDRQKVQALLDAADASARVKAILKERYEAARTEVKGRWKEYFPGRGTPDLLLASSRRLLEAERDLCVEKADRIAALRAHWQRLDTIHKLNITRFEQGRLSVREPMQTLFDRTGAEMALDREGAWAGPPSEPPAHDIRTHQ